MNREERILYRIINEENKNIKRMAGVMKLGVMHYPEETKTYKDLEDRIRTLEADLAKEKDKTSMFLLQKENFAKAMQIISCGTISDPYVVSVYESRLKDFITNNHISYNVSRYNDRHTLTVQINKIDGGIK